MAEAASVSAWPANGPASHLPPLPVGRQYRFHTMIKPAGALCNLDCPYCFYLHKTELLGHEPNARIAADLLEQHVRQYIEAQTGDEVVFSWQGGEPTVMGLAFYEKMVALQAKYARRGQRIENDLQTNGVLLDEAWARFLKQHAFHVGLSLDGPRELHDKYRPTKGGTPTFDKVMAAASLLAQHGVPFALLCVVNRDVARQPLEVWRLLTGVPGTYRVQFTPCVEPRAFKQQGPALRDPAAPAVGSPRTRPEHPLSIVTDWSVDARDYGEFLCTVWREWLAHDFGRVHVNVFESAVAQSLGLPAQMCTAAPLCGKAMALEHGPLRLPRVQARQHPRHARGRPRVLEAAGRLWPGQARHAPGVLPQVRATVAVLGRIPEEPLARHARRRGRPELPVRRLEALLRPGAARHAHDPPAAGPLSPSRLSTRTQEQHA